MLVLVSLFVLLVVSCNDGGCGGHGRGEGS